MKRIRFIFILIFTIIITVTFSSCKSQKKVAREDVVIEGEMPGAHEKGKHELTLGEKIVEECKEWVGTPYLYGHAEKGKATDCSGMVMVVYEEIGNIKIPRNSTKQSEFCEDIVVEEIKAGDLVFFATGKDKKKVSHVGVMIDKNKFVHASSSKGVVISEMTTPYYQRTFIKYGRVPGMK